MSKTRRAGGFGARVAGVPPVRARREVHDRGRACESARERLLGRPLERPEHDNALDLAAILPHDRPHVASGRVHAAHQ